MSSDREQILTRVRDAVKTIESRTPYPDYPDDVAVAMNRLSGPSLWDNFAKNFAAVNGRPMTAHDELTTFLQEQEVDTGYCDPDLYEAFGKPLEALGLAIHKTYDRSDYDRYQFGITRASGAIAETGTVVLTDSETSDRLGALTPWIHIAVLKPSRLVRSIGDAIGTFGGESNIIWATGPSKTADIEGILIEGVHGPGEQICFFDESG